MARDLVTWGYNARAWPSLAKASGEIRLKSVSIRTEERAKVWSAGARCLGVRNAIATVVLLLLAALSMANHWGGAITWETDSLFYQATTEQILGADGQVARERIFSGPMSAYERGLEAEAPEEPKRVSDPAWVEYSAPFYARRLLLPALAAALNPLLGLHALEALSLLGFVLVPALLFWLLRFRFSAAASFAVSAAVILWPPLRAWSVFPLTDSAGLVLMIAGLICAVLTIERGSRWLLPWVLCAVALSFTRDITFLLVVSALALFAVRRDRRSAALAATGFAAALPAPLLHGVSEAKLLNFVYADHAIPADTGWGAAIAGYPDNLAHMAGRYLDYAVAEPLVVLIAIGGIVAAFALASRRDPLTVLLWATLPGYLFLLVVGPAFSVFRYELVLIPLMAFGYGCLAERALSVIRSLRGARNEPRFPLVTR